MLIYWVLLLIITFFGMIFLKRSNENQNFNKKQNNLFIYLSGLLLWGVAGFRGPHVGTDTSNYLGIYDFSKNISMERLIEGEYDVEKGFILMNKVIGLVFENRYSIIPVSSLFIIVGILYFIKINSSDLFMSVYLFITLNYFSASMNIVRQFIAIAIFFIGYEELKKNKKLRYFLLIILASTIHLSSLVYLIVPVINRLKPNSKNMRIIGFFSLITTVAIYTNPSIITSISGRYAVYSGTRYFEGNAVRGTVMIWVTQLILYLCAMYILHNHSSLDESKKKSIFLNSIMILFSICVGVVSTRIQILARVIYYFDIFMVIIIPEIINQLIREKFFTKILICFILALYFLYNLMQGGSGVVPYNFFWQTF